MSEILLVGTSSGLLVCRAAGQGWEVHHRGLNGLAVNSVIAREGVILAGTRTGVYRSDDLGKSWSEASLGLKELHIRWLAYRPEVSDFELAGTEPAAIFVSRDGAGSWRECPEVTEMRARFGWSLPYSPEAGCVRGFAFHGERAYAAVEDGAVLVSNDGGLSWELAGGSRGPADHAPLSGQVHSDVHSIETHPSSPELVFAPTGGGFFRSQNGGRSWENLYPRCYCRAAWIDPADAQHILLGPADGVDRGGRIEETRDGGRTWAPAWGDLDAPWPRHMVERFAQVGERLLAVLSNGALLQANPAGLRWQPVLQEVPGIRAVAPMAL